MNYIYGLKDPKTGDIRYIGKTNDLKTRLAAHISATGRDRNNHKRGWVLSLQKDGLQPEMIVLEEVPENLRWQDREVWWIQKGIADGWPLTNIAAGGDAEWTAEMTPEGLVLHLRETLRGFVDPDLMRAWESLSSDMVAEIAIDAASQSIGLMGGYFDGSNDGRIAYEMFRAVVNGRIERANRV